MKRLVMILGLLIVAACSPSPLMVFLPPLDDVLVETVGQASFGGQVFCAYDLLAVEQNRQAVDAFTWALCMECYLVDGTLQRGTGSSLPVALHLQQDDGAFLLAAFEIPGDGSQFMPSIERIFPEEAILAMCLQDTTCYNERAWRLEGEIEEKARAFYGLE